MTEKRHPTSDPQDPASMRFEPGDRVRLKGHEEFPDGIVGTIEPPPDFVKEMCGPGEWRGHRRISESVTGPKVTYFVAFDEPQDDGSGEGPYKAAEIEAAGLRPVEA